MGGLGPPMEEIGNPERQINGALRVGSVGFS